MRESVRAYGELVPIYGGFQGVIEMMWGYGGLNWWWMAPMMVLFWGAVIAVVVLAVRARTGSGRNGEAALETLRMRLASGDITQEDFDKTSRTLKG